MILAKQVVVVNGVTLRRWAGWLREDLIVKAFTFGLKRISVPPSPFLVIEDQVAKTFIFLVEPHLVDAEFREGLDALLLSVWSSSGHCGSVFWPLLILFLPQEAVIDLPRITGQDLLEVARAKRSTGRWVGWVRLE